MSRKVIPVSDLSRLPTPVTDAWDWQLQAVCRELDSAVFFAPTEERGQDRFEREERAKAICVRCPVVRRCREHALAVREPYGVWGAMTANERRRALAGGKQRQAA